MKTMKKIAAIILCLAVVFALSACHKKDEIAVTVKSGKNEMEFTSAMYSYALLEADMEARNTLESQANDTITDYYSKQIDGMKYVPWVEKKAMENLKTFAYYNFKAKELGVELTAEEIAEAKSYAETYWDYYGYGDTYEQNGVGKSTFATANTYYSLSDALFKKIYGEGGEKEVSKATIEENMLENFEVVNLIAIDISEYKEKEVTETKNKLEGYKKRLKKGESFEKIYGEYYDTKPEDHSGHTHDGVQSSEDHYATVVGSKDTDYAIDIFDDIKKMKEGDISVFSDENYLYLVVRKDLNKDKYFFEKLKEDTLWLLKEADYLDVIAKNISEYELDENTYATNLFKVKKIKYPAN